MNVINNTNAAIDNAIDLVATEIFKTTGARVLASANGIADGIDCPDDLYEHCVDLIGNEATVEGHFDGDRWCTEPEEGELCLGHGIPFDAFEGYLALQEHFGEHWLSKTLTAYFDRPENAVDDVGREVRAEIKAAHARYEATRKMHLVERLSGLGDQLKRLALEGQGLMRELREQPALAA